MDIKEKINETGRKVGQRVLSIRVRTLTLTLAILLALVFYIIVNVTTRQAINFVDFALLCIMQILAHAMYYPDGDLFGQKSDRYVGNKKSYNDKADAVLIGGQSERLAEYCEWEYEQRKARYVKYQLGLLGINENDLEFLKGKTEKEIKKLKKYEYTKDGKDYTVCFSKTKRNMLYDLIFKPLPVEKNNPETILSAVENDGTRRIRDNSKRYSALTWAIKLFCIFVIGTIFAYLGYSLRDNFGFPQVVQMCMYLTTLFSTAVTSYSSGETCSRVHRANFYKDLADFLDGFNEWNAKKVVDK